MADCITGITITTNGVNGTVDPPRDIPNSIPIKPARKKSVSFHDNVTDIDAESTESSDNLQPETDQTEDLGDIFNVSEKINFFKNAFNGDSETKEDPKSLAQQTSIPQARLAFVTGMVQSVETGSRSRAEQGRDGETVAMKRDDDDREEEIKRCYVVSVEVPPSPNGVESPKGEPSENGVEPTNAEMMAATTLTYSKIFATQKNMTVTKNDGTEAVVDTSSILEHKEELRELWEKRIMADENQSSSSSIMAETNNKPLPEEETEEKVPKSGSESNDQHKMSNGFAKHIENNVPDDNANHIHECNGNVVRESRSIDADQENNNSADSLEEDNNDDYVEQKTYTSNFEQALVMTETKELKSEATISTTTTVQEVQEVQETIQVETQEIVSTVSEEHTSEVAVETEVEKEVVDVVQEQVISTADITNEGDTKEVIQESVVSKEITEPVVIEETVTQECQEKYESLPEKILLLDVKGEDEDGFVRIEECLPRDDDAGEEVDLPVEHFEQTNEDHEAPSTNGFGEPHFPLSPTGSVNSDKVNHPEMEQFVKSGGVKRIIPGVQKTEQPYSTCTTETKIAMEIREMREREEELRIMREQALLSPVASPVPPKTPTSIRSPSPSPSPKEAPSPVPQGPGYRVSSVFGHKGAISPSPSIEEEKKVFKPFINKESAVEKEIRLAKDREEELRKQKGLPPREDDSYVKPSQVKSSQVRVFGKMAGTNNSSVKQAATAKIQLEIEEQTQREMALRETGSIQTISQERTDAKVAKLKTAETTPPPPPLVQTNGNSHPPMNGTYTNGHSSPDSGVPYKRSSPSPTNARPASIFAPNNGLSKSNISMHKFIASKGKETTFSAPRNGPFLSKDEIISRPAVPPTMIKLKRNVSVESKIQQEIMEMKQREEELKKLHLTMSNDAENENGADHEMNRENSLEYENGNGNDISDEEISPRHNKLIAQWEQRIQKAES